MNSKFKTLISITFCYSDSKNLTLTILNFRSLGGDFHSNCVLWTFNSCIVAIIRWNQNCKKNFFNFFIFIISFLPESTRQNASLLDFHASGSNRWIPFCPFGWPLDVSFCVYLGLYCSLFLRMHTKPLP